MFWFTAHFLLLNNPLTDMVGAMECKIVWKMTGMEMDLGSTWVRVTVSNIK